MKPLQTMILLAMLCFCLIAICMAGKGCVRSYQKRADVKYRVIHGGIVYDNLRSIGNGVRSPIYMTEEGYEIYFNGTYVTEEKN